VNATEELVVESSNRQDMEDTTEEQVWRLWWKVATGRTWKMQPKSRTGGCGGN
jgi:hypothetical protein